MSGQEKVKFNVQNGRYAGSVIELEPDQEYSLGRSFHCDIAIDDPRFAERQMLLNVTRDGVHIKLLAEGTLSVNDQIKDTHAQSEWRHMDPRSTFIMNDLEFAFDIPSELLSQYEQSLKSPDAKTNSDEVNKDGEEISGQSQKVKSEVTQSQGANKNPSKSSTQALASTLDDDDEFESVETQVPTNEEEDRKEEADLRARLNLADELDLDVSAGPKYTRATSVVKKDQDNKKPFIIGGAIAASLLLGLGVYVFTGSEKEYDNLDADLMASSTELNSQNIDADVEAENNELSPFTLQTDDEFNSFDVELVDPLEDDPFAQYDRANQQSAFDQDLATATKESNLDDNKGETEREKNANQEDSGELESDVADKSADLASRSASKEDSESEKADEGRLETPKIESADQVTARQDTLRQVKPNQSKESEAVTLKDQAELELKAPDQSFGQLKESATAGKPKTEDGSITSSKESRSNKNTRETANNDGLAGPEGIWAVIRGKAEPRTIAVQSTRNLLSGLALGNLAVDLRAPRKVNGVLQETPVLVVSGYVPDRRLWMRAKDIMRQDLQGIGTLVDNVSSPEVRKAQLERWIAKSDLEGKVKTYLSERGLIAKVNLNPSQVDAWEKIARQYVKKFDNTPELFVMRDPGDWLQIRSVSFGEKPYLVTTDGAILAPGARLSNGYSIIAIRRSGVELRDKFGSYTYVF